VKVPFPRCFLRNDIGVSRLPSRPVIDADCAALTAVARHRKCVHCIGGWLCALVGNANRKSARAARTCAAIPALAAITAWATRNASSSIGARGSATPRTLKIPHRL
jgi:hypothetical protein